MIFSTPAAFEAALVEKLRARLTAYRAYTALGNSRSELDDFKLIDVSLCA
jgi:hypothetical protein